MVYKYSAQVDEKSARAVAIGLAVSFKKSVEVCDFVRGRNVAESLKMLQRVVDEKMPVPFRRFNRGGTGHRPKMGPGRYPIRVCSELISLLKEVEANAGSKGLGKKLVISTIVAKKAATSFHYGRKRRRRMKRTHIEVHVKESK